jgi:4-amino-4-deoxy-L-arabinose transferase-like glycosyltransferase
VISTITVIPIYYICTKFIKQKYAFIASALFVLDPRILLNSLLGATDPLYILLGATSLLFLLKNDKKFVLISFVLAAFCTIVRGEGIFFFFAIIVIYLIRNKISKESIFTIIPSITLFFIILLPMIIFRIDATGTDGIFVRTATSLVATSPIGNEQNYLKIFQSFEIFFKYLGWIMIPNFIFFVPLGIIQYFKNRKKENNFVIIFSIIMALPMLYAYSVPALDTRYLYFLFPILCLLSGLAIQHYFSKIKAQNYILVVIFIVILFSSVLFYEYKKDDWRMDKNNEDEYLKISQKILKFSEGINYHPTIGRYLSVEQLPNQWPISYKDISLKTELISPQQNSLNEFIQQNRESLTHIVVDNKSDLPKFLIEVYEKEFEILDLVYEYEIKNKGEKFKVFKINYDLFNLKYIMN